MIRVACAALAFGAALAPVVASAADVQIDRHTIERAIAVGLAGAGIGHEQFHEAYNLRFGGPDLERIEIITEFRRVVLAAEEAARRGDRVWSADRALEALRPHRGRIAVVAYIRSQPMGVYHTVPAFEVVLHRPPPRTLSRTTATAIKPVDLQRTMRYRAGSGEVVSGVPSDLPIGFRIESTFDAAALDPRGTYLLGIVHQQKEIQRVVVDLSVVQ